MGIDIELSKSREIEGPSFHFLGFLITRDG
jgi:hypothetical protein